MNREISARTELTLMPALLHWATALGTLALGGSIMAIKPTKQRPSRGKLGSSPSVENWKPSGKREGSRSRWTKPRTRSPMPARVVQALVKVSLTFSVTATFFPSSRIVAHLYMGNN